MTYSAFPAIAGVRMVRTAALLLAAVALMACSTVKVAYNNAASLSYWWLDGYLDLDSAQSLKVRDDLAALLDWHRHEELPKLSALLQRAAALTPRDMTPEQVCGFADDIRARLLAVAERAEPTSAAVASTLSPAQLEHLERKYAKNNADFRSDWLARSPAAQKEKRLDQFVERAEDFYGSLDAAQRELLRQRVQQSVWNARLLDAERRRRQQETLALLRRVQAERMPVAEVRVALRGLVQRIAEAPPGPWREHQAAQVQEGCRNIAALHNSTSAAQRERAARRLADYDADVRELAAQP